MDALGLLTQEEFDHVQELLQGDARMLEDAIHARISLGSSAEERHQYFRGHKMNVEPQNLADESIRGFKRRLAADIASLGAKGGELGFGFAAKVILQGIDVELSNNDPEEKYADLPAAGDGKLYLYSHSRLYSGELIDVRTRDWRGEPTEDKLEANSYAWFPETVLAHELGHLFAGIQEETINVVLVQNAVAQSLRENGFPEITCATYLGSSVWPEPHGEGENRCIEGALNNVSMLQQISLRAVSYERWMEALHQGRQLREAFLDEWARVSK